MAGADAPVHADATCGDGDVAGARGTCDEGQVCVLHGTNPYNGTVGFDNIGLALMTTFQARAARYFPAFLASIPSLFHCGAAPSVLP